MDALMQALVESVFYWIGRLLVGVLTLGFVRSEYVDETLKFPWYAFTRDDAGKLVASGGFCSLVGGLALAVGLTATVMVLTS